MRKTILLFLLLASTALAQTTAPAFTLKDSQGKTHSLSDYKGKIVVLEWFNPGCPFVKMHHEKYKTFVDLNQAYASKGVIFLAIDSTRADRRQAAPADWGVSYPVLYDADGSVARAYHATATPQVFVIDAQGMLRYSGAPDDDGHDDKAPAQKTSYLKTALDELLGGQPVAQARTQPYGCSIKF